MKRTIPLLLAICCLLTGCGTPPPASLATQTAMVQVAYITPSLAVLTELAAPRPTYTPVPPTASPTITPTATITPTVTLTPTMRATATATPTPRPTVTATPAGLPTPAAQIEGWGEQFADWSYAAAVTSDSLSISTNWLASDISSGGLADLNVFASRNLKLLDQVKGNAPMQIVFAQPLTVRDYTAFVQSYRLSVNACFLRYLRQDVGEGQDRRLQATLCSAGAALTTTAPMLPFAGTPTAQQPTFRGVIEVEVVLNAAQAKRVFADKRVFAVDATLPLAIQAARAHLARSHPELASLPVPSRGPRLFWALEDVGLVQYLAS